METVLETLFEQKFYLEYRLQSIYCDFAGDLPKLQEKFIKDINAFEQVIDIIEKHIKIKNNK